VIGRTGEHTAILFFSHRPEREWQNKQFVPGDYAKHQQVAEALYEHTQSAVAESGLPVLEINGSQQSGPNFGARLANAFADAFSEGYEHVIAVGSDCPQLHGVDWAAVTDQLAAGAPVLGPTTDGDGAYLIGLSREHFHRGAFASLPWQSSTLLPALTRHLTERTGRAPSLRPARRDVNGHVDLVALTHRPVAVSAALLLQLRSILGPGRSVARCRSVESHVHCRHRRARAPPAAA